jgi:hypothetical protein
VRHCNPGVSTFVGNPAALLAVGGRRRARGLRRGRPLSRLAHEPGRRRAGSPDRLMAAPEAARRGWTSRGRSLYSYIPRPCAGV